jgi:hypothetical protein
MTRIEARAEVEGSSWQRSLLAGLDVVEVQALDRSDDRAAGLNLSSGWVNVFSSGCVDVFKLNGQCLFVWRNYPRLCPHRALIPSDVCPEWICFAFNLTLGRLVTDRPCFWCAGDLDSEVVVCHV